MVSTETQIDTETQVDHTGTHSLWLHPAESVDSTLLPVVFEDTRYRSWRRGILWGISVKNKIGFINGKCIKPAATYTIYGQWERCDNIVTSWILNSHFKDITDSLQYVNTVLDYGKSWRIDTIN